MNPSPHHFIDRLTSSVGSLSSLVVHTVFFFGALVVGWAGIVPWELVLLVLTTVVSLEAIYLAIFIQMTVNQHKVHLQEVEKDVEEIGEGVEDIQEDIEEISEDVEDISEEVEEISEDVEDIQEDIEGLEKEDALEDAEERKQTITLESLTNDMKRVLADLEALKSKKVE